MAPLRLILTGCCELACVRTRRESSCAVYDFLILRVSSGNRGTVPKVVDAEVPLAEMFGYATDLRSATQGRATFTMEFEKYAEAPKNVTEAVMAKNMG